jgi:hypothetical protein
MDASEGLGGALITGTGGFTLEDMESERRGNDDDDFGDEDPEWLRPSRSLECRLDGGLTSFEKKPGAILYVTALLYGVSDLAHTRPRTPTQLEITMRLVIVGVASD